MLPVEEADGAGELSVFREVFGRDPQPAGDVVILALLAGGVVGRHTVADVQPVDRPLHADVVRVESAGHADDGLALPAAFELSTFLRRRSEHSDGRLGDGASWFCNDRPTPPTPTRELKPMSNISGH